MASHGFAHRRCANPHACGAEGQDGAAHLAGTQSLEGGASRVDVGHHHCSERLARRCFEGCFPALVDLDQIEQRPNDAAHIAQSCGAGAGAGFVECHGQRVGTGVPGAVFGIGLAEHGPRRGDGVLGEVPFGFGVFDGLAPGFGCRVKHAKLSLDGDELGLDRPEFVGVGGDALLESGAFARGSLDRDAQCAELTPDLGRLAARRCDAPGPLLLEPRPGPVELDLGIGQPVKLGHQRFGLELGGIEIGPQPGAVGFEVGHDTAVDRGGAVALDAA
ncbi:unannotated protein [freshwater metagenome]|uniref:Unannotated protein n=1 Tax=freshwater metagenome TaxID=449393 RepID=A0A6J6VWR4_9ZZZZ